MRQNSPNDCWYTKGWCLKITLIIHTCHPSSSSCLKTVQTCTVRCIESACQTQVLRIPDSRGPIRRHPCLRSAAWGKLCLLRTALSSLRVSVKRTFRKVFHCLSLGSLGTLPNLFLVGSRETLLQPCFWSSPIWGSGFGSAADYSNLFLKASANSDAIFTDGWFVAYRTL